MPKITKTLVDNTKAPATGELWIWDTELPGFGVRIHASGRKTYVLRYRTKDAKRTQRKMTLCRTCDAPPEKARNLARDKMMEVAAGLDPLAERRPTKTTVTLEAMFKARIASMKEKGRKNATEVERVLLNAKKNAADALGRDKAPGEVTSDDIVNYISTFYNAGHRGAADKARGYLHAAFEWAIKSANDYTVKDRQDWGLKVNPVAAVAKDPGAIKVRDRNLDADEIRALWIACTDGNTGFTEGTEMCLKLIIACGQRVQETLRLEGKDLDLDKKLWIMPAEKTKGGRFDHIIPLPDIIIPDLKQLKEKHGDGTLFPVTHRSKKGGITSALTISQAVRRFVESKEAEIEPFQPRDLRRTWKSRTHDAGVDRFYRDLIQQHAKNDTGSKHYDRADYLPQKTAAMKLWNDWLTKAVSPLRVVSEAA